MGHKNQKPITMKETEQEYLDSYSRPEGCLAIISGGAVLLFILSITLNVILLIKLF